WAARQHAPAAQALGKVGARFRALQNTDGSWGYSKDALATALRDSMTCAGLLGLAVARGLEPPAGEQAGGKQAEDPAIEKGLRYLAGALKAVGPVSAPEKARRLRQSAELVELMTRGPKLTPEEGKAIVERIRGQLHWRGALVNAEAMGDLYFLWSVERVAVLYDLKTVGEVDWYAWGSEILLEHQGADGGWRERFPGIPDTCFALLFLRRANLVKDLTQRLQGSLGLAADVGSRNDGPGRKRP